MRNLPDCLIKTFELARYFVDILHTPVAGYQFLSEFIVPQTSLDEIVQQVLVQAHKLSRQHPAREEVGGVGFEALTVAEYLRCRSSGHWCDEQRVAQAVRHDFRLERTPVLSAAAGCHSPHVELEDASAGRRPRESLLDPFGFGQLNGFAETRVLHGFEDLRVDALGIFAFERNSNLHEQVSHALHSQSDRPVSQVRLFACFHRLVRLVYDQVHVADHEAHHVVQCGVIHVAIQRLRGHRQTGQVAHGCLFAVALLDDLRAQVRRPDGAQVLLVALPVTMVLEQHVGSACLDLTLQYGVPQVLCFYRLLDPSFCFVVKIFGFEL